MARGASNGVISSSLQFVSPSFPFILNLGFVQLALLHQTLYQDQGIVFFLSSSSSDPFRNFPITNLSWGLLISIANRQPSYALNVLCSPLFFMTTTLSSTDEFGEFIAYLLGYSYLLTEPCRLHILWEKRPDLFILQGKSQTQHWLHKRDLPCCLSQQIQRD